MATTDMSAILAALKNKRKDRDSRDARANIVSFKNGKTKWRILPGWRPEERLITYYHPFGEHWIKDAAGQVLAKHICVDKTLDMPCDICTTVSAAIAGAENDDDVKVRKEWKSGLRYLVNAIDLNDGSDQSKPIILGMPKTVWKMFDDLLTGWMEEHSLNVLDLEHGFDIIVTREGAGMNVKYAMTPAPKERAVNPKIMELLVNLDEFVNQDSGPGRSKVIAAIGTVTGTADGSSAIPMVTPRALPRPSAPAPVLDTVVDDAPWEEPAAPVPPKAAPKPAPKPVEIEVEAVAPPAPAAAKPRPPAAKAAPAPAAKPAATEDDAEIEAMLAGLN